MSKLINIVLRELEIKDLEDYFYWNHPSCEFHKFNGPYYLRKSGKYFELNKFDLGI